MIVNKSLYLLILLAFFACNKDEVDRPANLDTNEWNTGCATCPSLFHPFTDLDAIPPITCDDFTNLEDWPATFYSAADISFGGIIGTTQGGTQFVSFGEPAVDSWLTINEGPIGINGGVEVVFAFDGTYQSARFLVYAGFSEGEEAGFRVSDFPIEYYDLSIPTEVAGVEIEIDTSPEDPDLYEWFYITFTGNLTSVSMVLFETGVTELCILPTEVIEPPVIDKSHYVYFDDFFNYSGDITGSFPNYKTPLGYYGLQGANMTIDFERFLSYSPTKISFVHAYLEESSELVNIQLPNTPLIVTTTDSLDYYLAPYGYTTDIYSDSDGLLWQNLASTPITGATVDSIVIRGTNMNTVTLGVDLNESELRSVCSYYEF